MKYLDSVFACIFIITLLLGIFCVASNAISLYNCLECSAPWYIAFIYPGGVFAIILVILIILYFVLKHCFKK